MVVIVVLFMYDFPVTSVVLLVRDNERISVQRAAGEDDPVVIPYVHGISSQRRNIISGVSRLILIVTTSFTHEEVSSQPCASIASRRCVSDKPISTTKVGFVLAEAGAQEQSGSFFHAPTVMVEEPRGLISLYIFIERSSRDIKMSNDLIASSCAGLGMTFATKIPVSVLKVNRQYLLTEDLSSLSFANWSVGTDVIIRY